MITNPEVISELQRITLLCPDNKLLPAVIVDEARAETSPLHSWFQWDDSAAAHAYRLQQARQMLRVVMVRDEVYREARRVWVSLSNDREDVGGGYRELTVVMANPDLRAQLLADAKRDMIHFKAKYARLTELAKVFDAMAEVQQQTPEHQPSV